MKKDLQRIFARRISQANRTELLVITYDMLLEELHEAAELLDMGDTEQFRHEMKLAQRFLGELMSTLDYRYSVSVRLLSLYEYVQRILVRCDVRATTDGLENAGRVIAGLREAYAAIGTLDSSEPVMANTQSVYAGLTYGRGILNELSMDPILSTRGYLA